MSEPVGTGGGADRAIARVDSKGTPFSARLKRAREAAGKSPEQMAALVGVSAPTYYDWEWGEGDISSTASLAELRKLSMALGVSTLTIFDDGPVSGAQISNEELRSRIETHLRVAGLSLEGFEDKVGYAVGSAVASPSAILEWNLDMLRLVCKELGVDWRLALP